MFVSNILIFSTKDVIAFVSRQRSFGGVPLRTRDFKAGKRRNGHERDLREVLVSADKRLLRDIASESASIEAESSRKQFKSWRLMAAETECGYSGKLSNNIPKNFLH